MTRETKIGLLVGLAFIIVVGILLGEHVSSTNEPTPASVSRAGDNVREGVTTPAGDTSPVSVAAGGARADAPRSPVPTRADLAQPPAPQPGPVTVRQPGTPGVAPQPQPQPPHDGIVAGAGRTGRGGAPLPPGGPMHGLMLENPEDLVPFDPRGNAPHAGGLAPRGPAPAPVAPPRTYTAEAGDSLSRIAVKMYGSNTKANRDLIIRGNPSLQPDGNRVILGKVYVIPNAAPVAAAPIAPAPAGVNTLAPPPVPPVAADAVWYTVKDNDNLWKIAESQLGSGNAWTTLRDANKDVLRGGETVRPNMRIRIPSRPLASASAN